MADMFDRAIFDSIIYDTGNVTTDILLGGGPTDKRYSYTTPYQKLQAAKKEVIELNLAIDHAAIEREAVEAKLQQDKLKAAQQKKLKKELRRLQAESLRLRGTLLALMELMIQWDEEDALLALAMSSPFITIKF